MLSSISAGPKDLQEKGEDVDDVQVNIEGSKDVFLRAHSVAPITHQELCVEGQELGKRRKQTQAEAKYVRLHSRNDASNFQSVL